MDYLPKDLLNIIFKYVDSDVEDNINIITKIVNEKLLYSIYQIETFYFLDVNIYNKNFILLKNNVNALNSLEEHKNNSYIKYVTTNMEISLSNIEYNLFLSITSSPKKVIWRLIIINTQYCIVIDKVDKMNELTIFCSECDKNILNIYKKKYLIGLMNK